MRKVKRMIQRLLDKVNAQIKEMQEVRKDLADLLEEVVRREADAKETGEFDQLVDGRWRKVTAQ